VCVCVCVHILLSDTDSDHLVLQCCLPQLILSFIISLSLNVFDSH